MTIDPKVSAILNVIVAVLGVLGTLTAQLTTIFGSGTADTIVTVSSLTVTIISAINSALHGVSSAKPGPLTNG